MVTGDLRPRRPRLPDCFATYTTLPVTYRNEPDTEIDEDSSV